MTNHMDGASKPLKQPKKPIQQLLAGAMSDLLAWVLSLPQEKQLETQHPEEKEKQETSSR
jgi:hypothetical protein